MDGYPTVKADQDFKAFHGGQVHEIKAGDEITGELAVYLADTGAPITVLGGAKKAPAKAPAKKAAAKAPAKKAEPAAKPPAPPVEVRTGDTKKDGGGDGVAGNAS